MTDPTANSAPTSDTSSDTATAQTAQTQAKLAQPLPAELLGPTTQAASEFEDLENVAELENLSDIESPGKIIRIGAMIKQLLEEVRNTSLDDASREQLGRIYDSSILELKTALSPELGQELDSLSFDFSAEEPPTEAEVRLAQAQLVGWLEGLFHGIQATLVAQQMAARQQLEGVRGELPERTGSAPVPGPGYI